MFPFPFFRTLLSEPNPSDPLMPEIADLYINNQAKVKSMPLGSVLKIFFKFTKTAKEWTTAHATQGRTPPPAKKMKI